LIYKDIWQSLETSALQQSSGHIVRRVQPQAMCNLFLAIAQPSGQRMLQVELARASSIKVANLPSARGLDASITYPKDGRNGFTIQLALKESRFADIFDALIRDVIEVVGHAPSEEAAVESLISRLQHWQKFLEQASPDGLSREAQQGLYGELWFLRERLIPLSVPYPALLSWVGPEGAHQDFQLQSCAIEVKTTGTKEPQQMIIQSERQLDDAGLAALFLFHLSVDVRKGTGESLVTIINSLRKRLEGDPSALGLYEDRLLEAGFLQSQSPQYEEAKYTIRHISLFRVRDAFPRIIEADLKPGVGSIRYSIAVAECRHFAVDENELKSQLTGSLYGK